MLVLNASWFFALKAQVNSNSYVCDYSYRSISSRFLCRRIKSSRLRVRLSFSNFECSFF